MFVKSEATAKAVEQDTMTQATRIHEPRLLAALCLLALCLLASATFSGRLISTQSPAYAPGPDLVLRATGDGSSASATHEWPADRSQDRQSRGDQQPATVGEFEDGPAKKFFPGLAVLLAPVEVWPADAAAEPEPAFVEAGSDASPPQLLQRPPPAG